VKKSLDICKASDQQRDGLQGENGSAGRLKVEGFGVRGTQDEVRAKALPTKHRRSSKPVVLGKHKCLTIL
jgi:hypothetical protein